MKAGRTLQELAIELDRQTAAKRDYIVNTGRMGLTGEAESFMLYPEDAQPIRFDMSGLFERQLGAALGIPAKYYDKMRAEYPALLSKNINGWFEHAPSKHTVRTLDGRARAFLSDRYRRIDNYDIAQAVLPVIGEMDTGSSCGRARVESCEVTENRMYLKVVNPRLTAEVNKGDVVQAGIIVSNSEVGLGSVSVMPLVFRLVCLNGMIVQDYGKRKYHIGRENEEAWDLYIDETLQADDAAFMLKLADIVRTAVDEARFSMVVDKLREAAGARITGHVPDVVELTARQYGMSKDEEAGILQHLIAGGDLSLYGLSNAITRAAQDVADYDRATALEGLGWDIATMPGDVWRSVNGG